MSFNIVDWVLCFICLLGGVAGAIYGFIDSVFRKFGYVFSLVFALVFAKDLSALFPFDAFWSLFLSYVILYVLFFFLIRGLGALLAKALDAIRIGFVNHALGFVLGIAEALVVLALLYALIASLDFITLGPIFDESWIITNILSWILDTGGRLVNA
ncbi:MAG: CvpA family protein [Sphaerochaetaceae bacterium]|jgi:membrane protein required for colicin V production|nr:CvpA family protein [Sphaerochaetaceae bacterium]